jgi:hypothetical protein
LNEETAPESFHPKVEVERPEVVFPVSATGSQVKLDDRNNPSARTDSQSKSQSTNEQMSTTELVWESVKNNSSAAKDMAVGMYEVITMREFWSGLPDIWVGGLVGARDWTITSLSDFIMWADHSYSDRESGPRGKHFNSNVTVKIYDAGIERPEPLLFNTENGYSKGRCLMVQKHSRHYLLLMFSKAIATGRYFSKNDFLINDKFQNLVLQVDYKFGSKVVKGRASVVTVSSKQLDALDLAINDPLTEKLSRSNQSIVYVDNDLDVNRQLLVSDLDIMSVAVDGKYRVEVKGHVDCKFSSKDLVSLD